MEQWRGSPRSSRGWPRWWSGGKWGGIPAVTDFVWLRRVNLVLEDPKKEADKGMCPCHQV